MKKWDPIKDSFSLSERINNLFAESHTMSGKFGASIWMPSVDIYETSENFVVKAELPEVGESDIEIKMEGNLLKISGERKFNFEGRNYHQVERSYGSFARSFLLPMPVEAEEIKAMLDDGILRIILPKKDKEIARHIEIK
ncbi:MAG: Hsp20/alpha crystallin family protein [Thermodesulfovibrionales bacterium]|nr:Hsp20/alpha crystallin family protein [Thermodesulfovibrionales bacterium]